ncbi:MAG: hypothetical protein WBA97_25390 [Actinophytocola sp.]|uniref:hypothetical protein n=1 Tax=Actinophytocola sp. TaxID=1872138 RepID=UPI003C71B997
MNVELWWRAVYQRRVASAFRTVPLYRERWALSGRTDPVVVPGRHGVHSGAIQKDEALRRLVDLVPLAGGTATVETLRGLGSALAARSDFRGKGFVTVLDKSDVLPPNDLPRGVTGCVLDVVEGPTESAWRALTVALGRDVPVVAVGGDKQLAGLVAELPEELAVRLDVVPNRTLAELDGGPAGLLHDSLLGYLGTLRQCGRWHLDWRRVYARETDAGLAVTLLGQRSPCLVDILVGPAVLARCPRHGTPVVLP